MYTQLLLLLATTALAAPLQRTASPNQHQPRDDNLSPAESILEKVYESMVDADGDLTLDRRLDHNDVSARSPDGASTAAGLLTEIYESMTDADDDFSLVRRLDPYTECFLRRQNAPKCLELVGKRGESVDRVDKRESGVEVSEWALFQGLI